MIRKIVLALAAAALAGGAASAATKPKKADRDDPNKLICKTLEESGQKLRRTRACHTAAEWRELQRQTRAAIERIQNSRATY